MVDRNPIDFPRSEKCPVHFEDESIEPTEPSSSDDSEEDWERGLQRYTLEQQVQLCRSYARHANNKLKARNKRRRMAGPLVRHNAMDGLDEI